LREQSDITRLVKVAVVSGGMAFAVFACFGYIAWKMYPYQPADDGVARLILWLNHVVIEKIVSLILVCVVGFIAARVHRPTRKLGIITGMAASLIFSFIAIVAFISQFGWALYRRYNSFYSTILYTTVFGGAFACLAVRKNKQRTINDERMAW
jgi:uncharacterized membrane protein YeaQ/YmgE (transglycosylase-associated protein family)